MGFSGEWSWRRKVVKRALRVPMAPVFVLGGEGDAGGP